MLHLDSDTIVVIDKQPDGKFTFTVKFRGVSGPTSRPMQSREDVELLGSLLLKHLQRHGDKWSALAEAQSSAASG